MLNVVLGLLALGLTAAAVVFGLLAMARIETRARDATLNPPPSAPVEQACGIHAQQSPVKSHKASVDVDPIGTVTHNQWKRLGRAMGPYNPSFRD